MILVTGGTGLIGSHLLFFLLKNEARVRAVHRSSSNLEAVRNVFSYYTDEADNYFDRIDWVEANITDIPALGKAFEDITTVYHVAAYVSFDPKNFAKLQKSNVEGTANVVNLCIEKGVSKLCHVSSIATLGTTTDGSLITEETHWNPDANNNVYAITKYGAEMEVWRGMQEGLKAVIVNPSVILGEGHWNSSSGFIIKQAAKGSAFYTAGGVGVVDVHDVVNAMIGLMQSDRNNERYVLSAYNLQNKELFEHLAREMGISPPRKEIAKWKLIIASKLDWLWSKLMGKGRMLPRAMVDSLYTVSFYDGTKITRNLEFQYTPLERTMARVVANFRKDKA